MARTKTASELAGRKRSRFKKNLSLLAMCAPAIILFFLFSYLPLPGLYMAFVNYNYSKGMLGSQFVGWTNFKFLTLSGDLPMLVRNTVLYNLAFIFVNNFCQIALALMLNEIRSKRFRKVSQAMVLLPYFISFVIVGLFAYNILNADYGILNNIREALGLERIAIYSMPNAWPPIFVFLNLWKNIGYGTIIYFAAVMGIDTGMIEAAEIDGVTSWQRIRYIMLPCLRPTMVMLILFSIGSILRGNFQLFYNIIGGSNKILFETTDIIETYVYRAMMNNFNFSSAAAVSLFQSVFGFATVMAANYVVKRIEPDYALF
ncbi:MAG: sugar ABC transporter permease [Subdoligranulum sp.]|nr:sugar ABC transporter permease [Subdoligranulum sp.]